ncbi:MAG: class I SAM-dependent methyltransferase [Lacibacter sp.]
MDTQQAYNAWASQYDTNLNKTRDLEAIAMRSNLATINFNRCFEIGCGTGKNTVWFAEKAKHVTAVDLSEEMLAKAKEKVSSEKVEFKQADITKDWAFRNGLYDLVSFSLVLEHIDDLDHIFKEVAASLNSGGHIYIGELHPFKQYNGSKARFETETGTQVVQCFNHHLSDFLLPAKKYGLSIVEINEYFDDDNRNEIPRILTILLMKSS